MENLDDETIETCAKITVNGFCLLVKLVFYGFVIAFMYKHW